MILSGKEYHTVTSYDRYRMTGHALDWPNQPTIYKTYEGVDPIPLPDVSQFPETSLWVLTKPQTQTDSHSPITLERISQILTLSYSLTAKRRQPGLDFYFRSVASAGALFPTELYIGAYEADGLDSGLYHYDILNRNISPLRSGVLGEATLAALGEHSLGKFSTCFFITGIFFRSAWKYRKRALRYVLLDTGHLVENLLLAIKALRIPFSVHYDFDDIKMEKLLGLDGKREACLVCVTVGSTSPESLSTPVNEKVWESVDTLPYNLIEASRVSEREVLYEEIANCYQSGISISELKQPDSDMLTRTGVTPQVWQDIEVIDIEKEISYPQAVFYRRSKRNFINQRLSYRKFVNLLNLVTDAVHQDFPSDKMYPSSLAIGMLTGNIENMPAGFYLLDAKNKKLGRVSTRNLIPKMTSVCLDQEWLRSCAIHFLLVTNLEEIDRTWGARGYRYAMLTAGRIGQSIYLGATALGLGCCGIGALYDGEARELLGLNQESALLYLVAVGPVKQ